MMKESFEAIRVREVEVKYKTTQTLPEPRRIANSSDIFNMFRDRMMRERVEIFCVLLVNSKNQLIGLDPVSRGSLSTSIVHPREVFSNAIRLQAAAIVLMHNHPSEDPAPSREDRDCTHRLNEAGKLLGVRVLDHVVFGAADYYSFADAGQMEGA